MGMDDVQGAVGTALEGDACFDVASASGDGQQLPAPAVERDGVVWGDDTGFVAAEHGTEVVFSGHGPPGMAVVLGATAKASCVSRDEVLVEVFGGLVELGDALAAQLSDKSILEGAVESFSAPSCLGAAREGQSDGQLCHGPLKLGGRRLFSFGQSMSGVEEMAGAVEVEGGGESVLGEELLADAEAAVSVFVGLEASDEGFSGGVVAGEDEAALGLFGSEPTVGASVEKEQLSLAWAGCASSSVFFEPSHGPSQSQGSEPSSESLSADDESVVLGEGVGEVREVVVVVGFSCELDDLLAPIGIGLVGRFSAGVAMEHALGAKLLDASFEALDLPDGASQGLGGLCIGEDSLLKLLDEFEPMDLLHRECHLCHGCAPPFEMLHPARGISGGVT
jgi:hypothetical protein